MADQHQTSEVPGSIGGIYEPFKKYIKDQLSARRVILTNPTSDDPLTIDNEALDFQLGSRFGSGNSESFYAYTVEKQAFIRMMSGVDLRIDLPNIASQLNLESTKLRTSGLYNGKTEKDIILESPSNLAKTYILESGTQSHLGNDEAGFIGKSRGGIYDHYANADWNEYGNSYGDPLIRSNADNDYGAVPMPGIVDAEIRTKGDNGELREAKIKFVCFNRRQLDILETLYMRPGHYVALEWGWDPYIDNDLSRQPNTYSIFYDFFHPEESKGEASNTLQIDDMNSTIVNYKKLAHGNYDGFIGAVKNYTYKAREDGGYDCETELMSAGELLDSLKGTKSTYATGKQLPGPTAGANAQNQKEIETKDSLYYYLLALKKTIDNNQDELRIRLTDTQREYLKGIGTTDVSLIDGSTFNQELRTEIISMFETSGEPWGNETAEQLRNAKYIGKSCPELGDLNKPPFVEFITYTNPGYFTCRYTDGTELIVIAYNNDGGPVEPIPLVKVKEPIPLGSDQDIEMAGANVIIEWTGYQDGKWAREGEEYVIQNPYSDQILEGTMKNGNMGDLEALTMSEQREEEWRSGYSDPDSWLYGDGWINWGVRNLPLVGSDSYANMWLNGNPDDYDYAVHFKGCSIVTDNLETYYRWDLTHGNNVIDVNAPFAVITQASVYSMPEYKKLANDEYGPGQVGKSHFKDVNLYAKVKTAEDKISKVIEMKGGTAANQALTESEYYQQGVFDIISLYKWIQKVNTVPSEDTSNWVNPNDPEVQVATPFGFTPTLGEGLEGMLGNTIIKQVSKYQAEYYTDEDPRVLAGKAEAAGSLKDSGYRKNVYIRWDMLCQIINHLSSYKHNANDSKTFQEHLEKSGLKEPLMELTYLTPNQRVWNNDDPALGKKVTNYEGQKYYLRYSVPGNQEADPQLDYNYWTRVPGDHTKNPKPAPGSTGAQTHFGKNAVSSKKASELYTAGIEAYTWKETGPYHPQIGSSYDSGICLLPHMPVFYNMFVRNELQSDPDWEDSVHIWGDRNRSKIQSSTANPDNNVYAGLTSYSIKEEDYSNWGIQNRNSIGLIYLNLDFVLGVYEKLRFEKQFRSSYTYLTLNRRFSMLEFIQNIWEGVNDACAGYYNFRLVTEHERPNKARVIDFHVSGKPKKEDIFTFNPQGLKSITRQFFYDSKIDADMASAISIAAQAPQDIQSLEALSFKAFNRNIKSRFAISNPDYTDEAKEKKEALESDVELYAQQSRSLNFYLYKMNMGHFVITANEAKLGVPLISPDGAVSLAADLMELRTKILSRYPLTHKKAGYYREGTSNEVNAIVPLQFNFEIDGITGLEPLRIFKIDSSRLPVAYKRDDLAFIIKSESHKITSGQDWTVSVTGQLILMDDNPNKDGTNPFRGIPMPEDWKTKDGMDAPEQPNADFLRRAVDEMNQVSIKVIGGPAYARPWGVAIDELTSNKEGKDIDMGTAVGAALLFSFLCGTKLPNHFVNIVNTEAMSDFNDYSGEDRMGMNYQRTITINPWDEEIYDNGWSKLNWRGGSSNPHDYTKGTLLTTDDDYKKPKGLEIMEFRTWEDEIKSTSNVNPSLFDVLLQGPMYNSEGQPGGGSGKNQLSYVITSGRDMAHQGKSSKHNSGYSIDFVIQWGGAPGGSRRIWNGQYSYENGKPVAYKQSTQEETNILLAMNRYLDILKAAGIITNYIDEYNNPSGGATAPHYHITFDNLWTTFGDWSLVRGEDGGSFLNPEYLLATANWGFDKRLSTMHIDEGHYLGDSALFDQKCLTGGSNTEINYAEMSPNLLQENQLEDLLLTDDEIDLLTEYLNNLPE